MIFVSFGKVQSAIFFHKINFENFLLIKLYIQNLKNWERGSHFQNIWIIFKTPYYLSQFSRKWSCGRNCQTKISSFIVVKTIPILDPKIQEPKVPVFYCLMKKFKSLNFYQNFFSLILTNLDQTHRDLLKITTKIFW